MLFVAALLAGCAAGGQGGHLYSYPDADGRIVVLERPAEESPPPQKPGTNTPQIADEAPQVQPEWGRKDRHSGESRLYRQVPYEAADDEELDISLEPDPATLAKLEADERDRFITYYDVEGRLVREQVDLVAARAYRTEHQPFEEIAPASQTDDFLEAGYIQTVTPVSLDCCRHAFEEAVLLEQGKELVLSFQQTSLPLVQTPAGARRGIFIQLAPELEAVDVQSFKVRGGYLHPFILLLDAQATPLELINNVFTRRYKETWARYGHLEGTISVNERLLFMVFYIPYEDAEGARAAGIMPEPGAQPAASGQLVLKGR